MVVCCISPRPTYKRVPTLTNRYVLEPLLPPFPRPHIIYHRVSYLLSISCTITFASTTARHPSCRFAIVWTSCRCRSFHSSSSNFASAAYPLKLLSLMLLASSSAACSHMIYDIVGIDNRHCCCYSPLPPPMGDHRTPNERDKSSLVLGPRIMSQ